MANLILKGNTSGQVTIQAPDEAGTTTLTLPTTNSTLATQNALGVRNLIINGDMRIAQRGTSATTYSLSAGGFRFDDVDRFCVNAGNVATGQVSSEQISSTGLDGFPTAKRITVTTAEASPATNGYMGFVTVLEAQMLQHLKWGTSNAETLTLSFWVRSSITGTFGGNIIGADSRPSENRAYPYNYTISSANTWEKKTVTITGDVAGTMNNDNGQGFELDWYLYLGSDYQNGTENIWNSNASGNSYHDNTAKTNLLATSGATFDITGVQLEIGSATPFEHRPYDMELARCQRYYQRHYDPALRGVFTSGTPGGASRMGMIMPVRMRATPSASIEGTFNFWNGGQVSNGSNLNGAYVSSTSAEVDIDLNVARTQGQACVAYTTNSTSKSIKLDSEL